MNTDPHTDPSDSPDKSGIDLSELELPEEPKPGIGWKILTTTAGFFFLPVVLSLFNFLTVGLAPAPYPSGRIVGTLIYLAFAAGIVIVLVKSYKLGLAKLFWMGTLIAVGLALLLFGVCLVMLSDFNPN